MTTHNDESLKPCPFCGARPRHFASGNIFCPTRDCPASAATYSVDSWNRRAEQPQPAPMQVDSYPISFDEYAKGCSWTRDVREFGIRRHAFSAGYEAALASRAERQCDHIWEARPVIAGSAASPSEAVCSKCGHRPNTNDLPQEYQGIVRTAVRK